MVHAERGQKRRKPLALWPLNRPHPRVPPEGERERLGSYLTSILGASDRSKSPQWVYL